MGLPEGGRVALNALLTLDFKELLSCLDDIASKPPLDLDD